MNAILPWSKEKTGHLELSRAGSSVEIDGVESAVLWRQDGEAFSGEAPGVHLSCRVEKAAGGVRIACHASLAKPVERFKLHLFRFPALAPDHYAGCGERMGRSQLVRFPAPETPIRSFGNCVLTKEGESVVLSTPLHQKFDNFFTGRASGGLLLDFRLTYELRHSDLVELDLDPVTVAAGDPVRLLREYARDNVERPKDFSAPPVYGWNSWDNYRWTITEDEVIRNAEFIAADPVLSRHVKRIIVDDGWQYCYGEWEPNSLFPSGMKRLAERLEKMGFTPGLWLAPAIIEPQSRIGQLEADMLAMSEGGQPCLAFECMKRHGFVLDPTVSKSREFLEKLFDRYAAMGYGYFKLDFLAGLLNAERFHDKSVPRCRLIGKLLESVHAGIAGRAEVLGCNYPFSCGNIPVASVRTGSDIQAAWSGIKRNVRSVAYLFWAGKTLWLNDPDFALCRGPETSRDPDLGRLAPRHVFVRPDTPYTEFLSSPMAQMSLGEARVLLSVVLMAGGAINLSDKMYLLNDAGLDLARRIVSAPSARPAVPLDLFEEEHPSLFLQETAAGHRLLLVNWQDAPVSIAVPWARCGGRPAQVRDFWTDEVTDPCDTVELAPHTCRLWEF